MTLSNLPPDKDLQTPRILIALNKASRSLGELKGEASNMPNPEILSDTLFIQEALTSSNIENIVTTSAEVYQSTSNDFVSTAASETWRYSDALQVGSDALKKANTIHISLMIELFRKITNRTDGFRKVPVYLRNDQGEIVYTPPAANEINDLMGSLEKFINDDTMSDLDPLIKMALIHHQFESIHPFLDGNGRVGRIINILYLTKMGLIDIPFLYLSRGINNSKAEYYKLLQEVSENGNWEDWVIYMLELVEKTAKHALELVQNIKQLMRNYKVQIRDNHKKIYSQELLNLLFSKPYTRIWQATRKLGVSYVTASSYLNQLEQAGLVSKVKVSHKKQFFL